MRDPRKYSVLYLEDNADAIEMVSLMLQPAGIEVTGVQTEAEYRDAARSAPFDLYLLDVMLPTGLSYGLCRKLREDHPGVPVVFYSAMGFQTDIANGYRAGAKAYLVKPYLGDLAHTLKLLINHRPRPRANQWHPLTEATRPAPSLGMC